MKRKQYKVNKLNIGISSSSDSAFALFSFIKLDFAFINFDLAFVSLGPSLSQV